MSVNSVLPQQRWWALAVLSTAQLIVVLDATIVTISLPYAQADLHISDANRQWMLTAYTLLFGGLLLLGGRVADFYGRRRTFIAGLIGFAVASAVAGAATSGAMLFGGRALQGLFAALLAPAALSLVSATFTEAHERARAFAVFGGVSGAGLAIGLIGGGALTEYTSWRWCLLINTPIALITALAARAVVSRDTNAAQSRSLDLPGAVTVTAGFVCLVYGFTRAAEDGWGAPSTIALFVAGAVLLSIFVVIEHRSAHPLLPLHIPGEITRGGTFVVAMLVPVAMYAMFLFLSFYFQRTLGYSPLKAGLAFMPFPIGIALAAGLSSQLLPRIGARPLMLGGAILGTAGLLYLAQLDIGDGYWSSVFPAEVVFALGMAPIFVAIQATALHDVDESNLGVASGLLNAVQQLGASIGTALLTTISVQAAERYLRNDHSGPEALARASVHSYGVAFYWGAGFFAFAAVVIAVTIRVRPHELATQPDDEMAVAEREQAVPDGSQR